jgi:thioesterase domain-containing protein
MAQQLQAQGEEVEIVVMVDTPHRDYPEYLPNANRLRRYYYRVIARIDLEISNFVETESGTKMRFIVNRISRLLDRVVGQAETILEPISSKFGLEIPRSRAYFLDKLAQAHDEAYKKYQVLPYSGKVIHFVAAKRPRGIYRDPTLGWGEVVKEGIEVHEVPGYRIGILDEPRVQFVANKLTTYLLASQNGGHKIDQEPSVQNFQDVGHKTGLPPGRYPAGRRVRSKSFGSCSQE